MVWSQLDYNSTIWSPWLNKDKLELEKYSDELLDLSAITTYDPMYSVIAMIDQLNWQSLEYHRDTSHLCLLSKILHHQVHIPTCDIPAPITAARSSHEKNLSVPYMQEQMCTNIHSSHIQFHYGINYQK